jgi:hypothetical protein
MVSLLLQVVWQEMKMVFHVHVLVEGIAHPDSVQFVLFKVLDCYTTFLGVRLVYFASIDQLFLVLDGLKQLFHRFQVNQ